MITFEQFLEHGTTEYRHAWFYMYTKHYESLTPEEKKQVIMIPSNTTNFVKVWYPREKYFKQATPEQITNLIGNAIAMEDFALVKELKQMREMYGKN